MRHLLNVGIGLDCCLENGGANCFWSMCVQPFTGGNPEFLEVGSYILSVGGSLC